MQKTLNSYRMFHSSSSSSAAARTTTLSTKRARISSSSSSRLLTIREAVEQQQQQQHCHPHHCPDASSSRTTAAVDILAIVIEIIGDEYALGHQRRGSCCCRLSIVDHSLVVGDSSVSHPPISFAWFHGKQKYDWIVQELKLRVGDIIRLDRFQLGTLPRNVHNGGGVIAYDFHPCPREPSSEIITRWGHVDCSTGRVVMENTTITTTEEETLSSLVEWFLKSEFRTAMIQLQRQQQRGLNLQALPCQYRNLLQLYHTCRGVTSHVIASVLQIQNDDHNDNAIPMRSFATSRKKRRTNKTHNSSSNTSMMTVPKPTRVLLTDTTSTVMTFYLDNTVIQHWHFRETLQSALKHNHWVQLRRVCSQNAHRCIVPDPNRAWKRTTSVNHGDEEIFLVPTADTDIVFTEAPKVEHHHHLLETEQSSALSPPLLSSSQLFSAECRADQPSLSSSSVTRRWQIRSPILDIRVKGISIIPYKNSNSTPIICTSLNQLLRSNIDSTKQKNIYTTTKEAFQEYSESWIEIYSNHDPDQKNCTLEAIADGTIVRVLCGGLDAEEWSQESSLFRPMIVNMIQSLVNEEIELDWEIETTHHQKLYGQSSHRIRSVTLPIL